MDLLTKTLLEDLLDTKKTVAIYGGGFKPPTKGHFAVAKLTLEQFPEIDELKIFVGGGVRDGVTQDESIKIWDIYKNYLSPKVDVEASVAPVKSVLGYAKENPDTKVYWILGAREGDEGDLADIENRTKSISKYPNLEVKVITTSGGVSGTKTRQAIRDNNKEQFFHMIPDVSDTEKEEIWDMVSPIIKENVMDNMKTKIKDFVSAIKQEGKETKDAFKLILQAAKGEIELSNEQKEQIGNQLKDVLKTIGLTAIATLPGGFIVGALLKIFKQTHLITPSSFVNEIVTDTDVICDNCGWEWPIADGGDDLYICHKCGHDNTPKKDDPFGLNEYAKILVKEALIETWNPKESFVSLSKYMIDNGMKIQPLPKIKVIKDDEKNASNLLGKTAYYNPAEKSITLYTMDRHPKDILRSFAHEMIHHEQNLDGRLNNITTTNTNESGDLPEIEREAYEKGNMMFRNWEDSIKNV